MNRPIKQPSPDGAPIGVKGAGGAAPTTSYRLALQQILISGAVCTALYSVGPMGERRQARLDEQSPRQSNSLIVPIAGHEGLSLTITAQATPSPTSNAVALNRQASSPTGSSSDKGSDNVATPGMARLEGSSRLELYKEPSTRVAEFSYIYSELVRTLVKNPNCSPVQAFSILQKEDPSINTFLENRQLALLLPSTRAEWHSAAAAERAVMLAVPTEERGQAPTHTDSYLIWQSLKLSIGQLPAIQDSSVTSWVATKPRTTLTFELNLSDFSLVRLNSGPQNRR